MNITEKIEIPISSRIWKDDNGKIYNDSFIIEKVMNSLKDLENNYEIAVGTDSELIKQKCKFITALAIHKIGYGGEYFYISSYEPRSNYKNNNHQARIFKEVSRSIEIADFIRDKIDFLVNIHIDASPPETNEFTSKFSDQLVGYATASGYKSLIKPLSWSASSVANKHTKI